MTGVAVVAAKGSPGATTLSLAMGAVWPEARRVVVIECDPSGGDVAARFGLSAEIGVASLVLALRRDGSVSEFPADLVLRHAQQLPGGLEVLVGTTTGDSAAILDEELSRAEYSLAEPVSLVDREHPILDLIFDCGRLSAPSHGQRRLLAESQRVVLVARPDASSVVHSAWAVQRIKEARGGTEGVMLVTMGVSPFPPDEMAEALGVELLGSVPLDSRAAAILCGQPGRSRSLTRSALISATSELVQKLDICREVLEPALAHAVTSSEQRDAS